MTYRVVWSFDTDPSQAEAFERTYAANGPWVQLFREARGFMGTELLRSVADPARFVTIDTWESRSDYETFRQSHAAPYAALDAACEGLTRHEELLAAVETS